jgi:outer membrane protein
MVKGYGPVAASAVLVALGLTPALITAQEPSAPRATLGIVYAVQSTLDRHPLLAAQRQQVKISEAVKQQQSGAFDIQLGWAATERYTRTPLLQADQAAATAAGVPLSALTENSFNLTGSAQRLLRSGISFGPTIVVDRAIDNRSTADGLNRARISFDATVPLMRGRGAEVVAAPETAAGLEVEASTYDLGQQAADLVRRTAIGYWQYQAALRQLEIAKQSEDRGREFVQAVATLVQADRLPRSEVNQAQANFDSRAAGRLGLEQLVVEGRSALALAMGLPPDQIGSLPAPGDEFPDDQSAAPPSSAPDSVKALVDLALTRRADYLAAGKKVDAARVLRRATANRLRPQFDLAMSGGYSSLNPGRGAGDFLRSPFVESQGGDAFVGVRWSHPWANTTAQGEIAETEASYQQAVLLRTERARVIAADVMNAVAGLQTGLLRLGKARAAVTGFRAALEGEQDKLRLGLGSITDLLTVEGRLNDALQELVSAQQAYAVGVVQLRYASGTLVDPANPGVPERDVFFRPMAGPRSER